MGAGKKSDKKEAGECGTSERICGLLQKLKTFDGIRQYQIPVFSVSGLACSVSLQGQNLLCGCKRARQQRSLRQAGIGY